jgi:putative lipoprotein
VRRALLLLAAFLASPTPASAPPSEAESLHAFLQSTFADARAEWADTSYVSAFADLDGDGRNEALVSLYSGLFCGSGGCALYIYTPAGGSWREVAEITIVNAPVRLLASSHRGWRDLAVHVRGGGALPSDARLTFDGRTYASNPSLAPRLRGRVSGRVLIPGDAESRPLF